MNREREIRIKELIDADEKNDKKQDSVDLKIRFHIYSYSSPSVGKALESDVCFLIFFLTSSWLGPYRPADAWFLMTLQPLSLPASLVDGHQRRR